jgi:hypothetical protein
VDVVIAGLVALAVGAVAVPFALYRHYLSWIPIGTAALGVIYLAASAATGVVAALAGHAIGANGSYLGAKGVAYGLAGQAGGRAAWSPRNARSSQSKKTSGSSSRTSPAHTESAVSSVLLRIEQWILDALDKLTEDKVYDWLPILDAKSLATLTEGLFDRYVQNDSTMPAAARKTLGNNLQTGVQDLNVPGTADDAQRRLRHLAARWMIDYRTRRPKVTKPITGPSPKVTTSP